MIAPDSFRDRAINAVRATGWMAVPLMAEVVARLITSGDLARQARMKRDKAALRNTIVRRVLKEWLPPSDSAPGFHIWLPLPAGRTMNALVTAGRAGRHHAGASRLAAAHADRTPGNPAVPRRTGDRRKPGARLDRDQAHPGNGRGDLVRLRSLYGSLPEQEKTQGSNMSRHHPCVACLAFA
jgi:hypothetical protein